MKWLAELQWSSLFQSFSSSYMSLSVSLILFISPLNSNCFTGKMLIIFYFTLLTLLSCKLFHYKHVVLSGVSKLMKLIVLIILFQVSDLWKWSHRNPLCWQNKKANLWLWIVTLKRMMVIMSTGWNRVQTQLLSLCWDSIVHTALLTIMEMVLHPAASHLELSQRLIIVWSSVMWMLVILQCITVAHGTLLKSGYHSDSQHDKNLLTAHIHFCF